MLGTFWGGVMRRILCLAVLMLVPVTLLAQLPTATLNGTVADPQGAVVTGAKVTLTHPTTGATRETTTSASGSYVFTTLAAGTYNMRIEAQGFATQEVKDIGLEVGRADTLNVSLKVAAGGEVVTVTSDEAAVELTQSHVAGQIGASTVENIPLNGRNFLELAFLLPGNRPATSFDPTKTNTLEVSSAGAFGRGGNLTVDGGDNNDEVVGGTLANFPQDGVQEFQIATNRFTAEVGRSGSSIINIVTKSGTNDWHGSGFFFFRHNALQGLPATLSRTVVATEGTPPFDREQFGGSIGGPIKKDKVFVFGAVENRNQDATFEVVRRNLADYATCSANPTTPGCIIGTFAPGFLDDLLVTSRADFKVTDRDNIFVRYSFNKNTELAAASLRRPIGTAAQGQISSNRFHSLVADWTRTISQNKVNNLLFHVDTFLNEIPAFAGATPDTFPAGLAPGNEVRFPSFQDGASFRIPQRTRMNRYQIKDNFSWIKGKHNIRFGGEWQNAGSDVLFDLFGSGRVDVTEDFASVDRNGDLVIDDRDVPVLFTLGIAAGVPRPPVAPFYRNNYFALYFQDDWKVASNLTLNLGLRWDFDAQVLAEGPLSEACSDATVPTTEAGCLWLRRALGPHDTPNYKNFGPRFGFAWDPFRKGTTVVRGGYGIYYDRVVLEVPILEVLLDGRVVRLELTGGVVTGENITLQDPFAGAVVPGIGIGINIMDTKARQPLVQQFTVGLQHQFGRSWILSADGVHNFGYRLLQGRFLRQGTSLDPAITLTCPNGVDPCTVTDPATGIPDSITNIESSAKSWYSGLLANLQKKPTGSGDWKWGFNIAYTWSKAYNYANDDQIPFNGAEDQVNLVFDTNNPRLEKGYSPTDERHRLVFYGIFEMPWQISVSPILTLASSVPIDTFSSDLGSRLPLLQRNSVARDIQTGAELNTVINQWNALPACIPPTPTNVATRIFPCNPGVILAAADPNLKFGDGFSSLDMRITKTFTFAERHRLQLMGEVFNLFNITNIRGFNNNNYSGFINGISTFNPLNPTAVSPIGTPIRTAGGFFGAGGPRAFQFAVRYTF
ncbi:MAG: TonB-dependent receptor domain-containing protein [Terriglobales bacterium]